jgi:hypothetical protein
MSNALTSDNMRMARLVYNMATSAGMIWAVSWPPDISQVDWQKLIKWLNTREKGGKRGDPSSFVLVSKADLFGGWLNLSQRQCDLLCDICLGMPILLYKRPRNESIGGTRW